MNRLIDLLRFIIQNPRRITLLVSTVLLTACAVEPIETAENFYALSPDAKLRQVVDMQQRLDRVAGVLLVSNADLCRNQVRNILGFSATNKYSYSSTLTATAKEQLGVGEKLQVTNIIHGGGAEKAGLMAGDILLKIEGKAVPEGPTAESETVKLLAPLVSRNSSVKLTVGRNGTQYDLVVPLTSACGFRVELGHSDTVNALSDGQRIILTRGMMRFAGSDNELAYVIGKEMAHNVLNHARTLQMTDANKKTIDALMPVNAPPGIASRPAKPMTRQFDIDSDTLGLAMALRAGYEIDSAWQFWNRMAQAYSPSNPAAYTASHPNSQARLDAMSTNIGRIKTAEARKRALSNRN